ncbi:MAG: tetraacyldisaccharide 4'-kinase [Candidatus Coatesbacteria bacterium]
MERLLRAAWRREGAGGRVLHAVLLPASWAYGAAAALDRAWRRRLPKFGRDVPVVLVGNLTIGGTGKTPITIAVAERLRQLGAKPVIVSRGYGGRRAADPAVVADALGIHLGAGAAGDEPVMMARHLPGVPVVVGRDRVAAARLAVDRLGARSVILDDGFQQRARFPGALRILAVKATDPWGGGALLPAGSLREPLRGFGEADIIVLTHPRIGDEARRRLEESLRARAPGALLVSADHWLTGFTDVTAPSAVRPVGWLKGRTVLAMAGIADPWPFEAKLQSCGGRLAASCVRPDHHRWTPAEVARVMDEAVRVGADAVVTTAKDAVRLPLPARSAVPVLVAQLQLRFATDGERAQFGEALERLVRVRPERAARPAPLPPAGTGIDPGPLEEGGPGPRRRRRRRR